MYVVGLAAREDVADLLAREVDRRLAADVPRGDPIATGRLDIDLDLDLRNLLDLLDALVDDPVDLAHPGSDLRCLLRQDVYVRTEHAHDDRLVRPAQHLLDPLPRYVCTVRYRPG